MKKFLYVVIVAMTVASCCRDNRSMYFDYSDKRITNDPTAEFDTLSYALGMNLGLSLHLQPSGITFNQDALYAALDAELSKESIDYASLEENTELLQRFSSERLQPYNMAQFRNRMNKQDDPKILSATVNLFDSEFTEERVSEIFGRDIANFIYKGAYPLNMYWTRKAMEEAFAVESEVLHDSLMSLTMMQMRGAIQKYNKDVLPQYMAEASNKWLADIANKRGVKAMVVDEGTLYYRVDVKGNDVKPRGLNDTITLSYDLYTRSGKLVESLAKREAQIREALERAEMEMADTVTKSKFERIKQVQQLKKQLENTENLSIPVSKALLKGMQYAVQNIGEGGEITVWMPSSLAFGERGNRIVSPNDAVVMSIKLKRVSYGPTDEELANNQARKALKGVVTRPPKQKDAQLKSLPPKGEQKVVIKPVEQK